MLEGKQESLGIYYEEDFDTAAQYVCSLIKWRNMKPILTSSKVFKIHFILYFLSRNEEI